MKTRFLLSLSFFSLLVVFCVQIGGMFYAYRVQMEEAETTLNQCFRVAYSETIDNFVNNLPFKDGTLADIIFISPYNRKATADINERDWIGIQQTATTLQRVYGLKQIPLATIDSVLHNKLEHVRLKGGLRIERFNVDTGQVLEVSDSTVHAGFSAVTSDFAYSFKPRAEAVRAVLFFPFKEISRNVLLLCGITFLLLLMNLFAMSLQIKSLVAGQRNLQNQQQDFYALAQQMSPFIGKAKNEIRAKEWHAVEETSHTLLDMTASVLSKAKTDAARSKTQRMFPYRIATLLVLSGVFLLLLLWAGYLYHISYQKTLFKTEECFESAFYKETDGHRYKLFRKLYPDYRLAPDYSKGDANPYIDRLLKKMAEMCQRTGYRYRTVLISVYHTYIKIDESFLMHSAYALQDSINHHTEHPIPFSLAFADSVLKSNLVKEGLPRRGDLHWLRHPSGEMIHYTGSPNMHFGDILTKPIPLDEDSTSCVRVVLRSPQRYIIASVWYMFLPLGITLLFVVLCMFLQIRLFHEQRCLKQFQQDFTYAMVHDMKSPLQSVMMGAHILESGKLADKPEKVEKYCQTIADECEHLLALSNRVVLLTQIDRGELELHPEEVPLYPLLHDLAEKFSLKAVKPVRFRVDCAEGCTVLADVFCLREVLSNLIDNAMKYSGKEVEMRLWSETDASSTQIKVRDNGIGIPLHEQQKIFEKFERVASGSRKTGSSGFGLGLNYVYQVMQVHGGKVSVKSREREYSEFTLQFPKLVDM